MPVVRLHRHLGAARTACSMGYSLGCIEPDTRILVDVLSQIGSRAARQAMRRQLPHGQTGPHLGQDFAGRLPIPAAAAAGAGVAAAYGHCAAAAQAPCCHGRRPPGDGVAALFLHPGRRLLDGFTLKTAAGVPGVLRAWQLKHVHAARQVPCGWSQISACAMCVQQAAGAALLGCLLPPVAHGQAPLLACRSRALHSSALTEPTNIAPTTGGRS